MIGDVKRKKYLRKITEMEGIENAVKKVLDLRFRVLNYYY